jgi:lipid-binding SYLF domain-containing protein
MQKLIILICLVALVAAGPVMAEDKKNKAGEKKQKIDAMAQETLDTLFSEKPQAKKLYDSAYGYAVFDNLKLSLMISGGGGVGVAVDRSSGARTYMKMGTAGINIGLGGQKYQIVFFFETKKLFDDFVEKGWQADASANAVAGKAGANAEATFIDGMAFYQLSEAGLMLQADIAGTKYWKSKKLNK